jgi:NodT family efflux transporter outer membrane factor (OMF) lipoprotein
MPFVRPIFLAISLTVVSCETWRFAQPIDDLAIRTPGTWQAASTGSGGKISTGWVASFNSSALSQTVNDALGNNRDLKAAAARLKQAKETTIQARAGQLPSVSISGDGALTRVSGSDDPNREAYGLNLAAAWEPDLWGRLRDITRAAEAEERAAIEDFRGARLSLAANTAKAWCNLISAEQEIKLAAVTLESFERNFRVIERRFKGEGEGALDLLFARNNISSAKRALESRTLERDDAARSLELLLGRYPDGLTRGGNTLPGLPSTVPAGIPASLVDRRPDLAAARARLFASARLADAARKALLPSISLTGRSGTSTAGLTDLLRLDSLTNTIAARFSQIITEGGAPSAQARASLAANEALLHSYAQSALIAFREVESTLAADRSLARQENILADELKQAVLAERQAEREYSEGVNPNTLSLLEAQRRANNARASMIRLQNQRLQNRIDLHLALGGDFSTQP